MRGFMGRGLLGLGDTPLLQKNHVVNFLLNAVSNLPRMIAAQGLTRFENDQNWTGVLQVNAGATADTYIAAGTRVMAAALDLQGGVLTTGSGGATWNGAVTLTNVSTINATNGVIALTNAIGGAGGFTKTGGNTLTLSGAGSNYAGAASVAARHVVSRPERNPHRGELPDRSREERRRVRAARHHHAAPLRAFLQRQ